MKPQKLTWKQQFSIKKLEDISSRLKGERNMKHIHLDETTWTKIRAEWEAVGNARLLGEKYGVSQHAIRARRSREKWGKPGSRRDKIVEKAIEKAEEELIDESAEAFKKDNERHCNNIKFIRSNIMTGVRLEAAKLEIKKKMAEVILDIPLSVEQIKELIGPLQELLELMPDVTSEMATIRIAISHFVSLVRAERDIKGYTNRVEEDNSLEPLCRILNKAREEARAREERRLALDAEKEKKETDKVVHLKTVKEPENV
jgi:hypothetical protein